MTESSQLVESALRRLIKANEGLAKAKNQESFYCVTAQEAEAFKAWVELHSALREAKTSLRLVDQARQALRDLRK